MDIFDLLFVISFIALIGISLAKLFNVMLLGKFYDIYKSIIFLIITVVSWFITLVILLINPEEVIFLTLFRFCTPILILNTLFFIIELFIYIGSGMVKAIKPYSSSAMVLRPYTPKQAITQK